MNRDDGTPGWIILHRRVMDHWLYPNPKKNHRKPMTRFEAWTHMLFRVNYEDKKILLGNQLILCGRGQSLMSIDSWAKEFGWTRQKVRTFFNILTNDSMIILENVRKTTKLTICNYDTYQAPTTSKKPPLNHQITSDQPQLKEGNKGNEDKEKEGANFSGEKLAGSSNSFHNLNSLPKQGKEEKEKSSAKKEKEVHTPDETERFKKFTDWIKENSPRVGQMKEPFTIDEFLKLVSDFSIDQIRDTLADMHNWEPLLRKNRNANLTFRKWAKNSFWMPKGPHSKTNGNTRNSKNSIRENLLSEDYTVRNFRSHQGGPGREDLSAQDYTVRTFRPLGT